MRYRVDLKLKPRTTIEIFRQSLRNDSDVEVSISLTNITKGELVRNVDFLISNSQRLINENVMPEGHNGIVDFKVYDNPKRLGGRRNITFSSSINKDDYVCKFIDSAESNTDNTSFLNLNYDISSYLKCAGNPEVVARSAKPLEEVVTPEEEVVTPEEPMIPSESAELEEEVVTPEEEVATYTKGEDGKFYCPFEDCEKHKEGYATERNMKNHMTKVHGLEV